MDELVHKDSVRVGLAGAIFVLQYESCATVAAAKTLDDVLVKRFDSAPGAKWAIIVVIDASHPPPDPETRAAISKAMKSYGAHVSALAYVVIGSGFRAGTIRAALVGLNMISQASYRWKVFGQMGAAVDWISATAPEVLKPADLPRARKQIEEFLAPGAAGAPKPADASRPST